MKRVLQVGWWLLLFCAAASIPGARAQGAPSQVRAQHLTVSLVVPEQQLARGSRLTAGLQFKLEKGWHIYWVNAGDSGLPPEVKWTLPKGVTAAPFEYPAPERLPLGPLMDFGYEKAVTFPVPMRVGRDAAVGPAVLHADVNWLVCQNVCMPGKAALSVTRPVTAQGASVQVDSGLKAVVEAGIASLPLPLPPGSSARFAEGAKKYTLAVLVGHSVARAKFFPLDQTVLYNAAPQGVAPLAHGVRLRLVRSQYQQGKIEKLNGVVELPGGAAYRVAAMPGPIPPVVEAVRQQPGPGGGGLAWDLLLAFAGGILLNLMPCVFPVLFIKALSLVQSSREQRGVMRAHGWVYTLGILVSFWVVVGVLLGLRAAGEQLGWGFQFQSPVFLALMAMFLFFLALSLAGQFEIGLSVTSAGGSLARKQGYAGSFFTGVLAMVVATPCAAPFMGVAVGYAVARGGVISFLVFTALGLGLAAPYLLLAYFPRWTRLLPKPGAWMEILKQLTAIPVFATVIWLVWLFTQSVGANALLGLLAALLLLAVAGSVMGRWPARRGSSIAALLLALAAIALPVYAVRALGVTPGSASAPGSGNAWKPFKPGEVAAYQAQGKPVFVDFTASWCLSCQVNERVVLDRADVQKRLRDSGVVLLRADWTRHSAAITEALAALGRSEIPTYALYPARPGARPKLLPEVLTPGSVYKALDGLTKADPAVASAADSTNRVRVLTH